MRFLLECHVTRNVIVDSLSIVYSHCTLSDYRRRFSTQSCAVLLLEQRRYAVVIVKNSPYSLVVVPFLANGPLNPAPPSPSSNHLRIPDPSLRLCLMGRLF
ncbi:hypothetical protein Y032_1074g3548 [Ancylostoma ceylanicum]|nr:hypothetical protein Y032_1074g3548 [Ancylostoma ceylanicum]